MSAFAQPPIPGYSPWPTARQDTPFLQAPGPQGLQEGVSQGQGSAFTPSQELFAEGTQGPAPPSSIAEQPAMWTTFGAPAGARSTLPQAGPFAAGNVSDLITAL